MLLEPSGDRPVVLQLGKEPLDEVAIGIEPGTGHSAAITPEALAGTSPYLNEHFNRFGSYELDLTKPPAPLPFELPPQRQPSARGGACVRIWRGSSPWSMLTPGRTLCAVAYLVGDAAFINDTMFMPDTGTARADFPGGSAALLWRSIKRILELSEDTRLFTGHDYRHGGREPAWESTIAEQRALNPWLQCMSEAEFVEKRANREATLPMPVLMLHALQVNINAGRLPAPDDEGRRFLKIPLDCLSQCDS